MDTHIHTFKYCIHSIIHEWTLFFPFKRHIEYGTLNANPLASMVKRKSLSKHFFCVDSLSQQREREEEQKKRQKALCKQEHICSVCLNEQKQNALYRVQTRIFTDVFLCLRSHSGEQKKSLDHLMPKCSVMHKAYETLDPFFYAMNILRIQQEKKKQLFCSIFCHQVLIGYLQSFGWCFSHLVNI